MQEVTRQKSDETPSRLASLRQDGESEVEFSERVGIARGTLMGWIKGKHDPKAKDLAILARNAEVSSDWLLGLSQSAEISSTERPHVGSTSPDLVQLPRFDAVASAGPGTVDTQVIEASSHIAVERVWLNQFVPASTLVSVIEARGDSMERTIFDGDTLMLRHDVEQVDIVGGGVFALTLDDALLVKRIQFHGGGDLHVTSDNERYPDIPVPRKEWDQRVVMHGKVFWAGGHLRPR